MLKHKNIKDSFGNIGSCYEESKDVPDKESGILTPTGDIIEVGGLYFSWTNSDENELYLCSNDGESEEIHIPDYIELDGVKYNVVAVGPHAGGYNKKAKCEIVGGNVRSINAWAFYGNDKLEYAVIKAPVEVIGRDAFAMCNWYFKVVVLDKSVKVIYPYAFDQAPFLTDVFYTGSEEDRRQMAISENNQVLFNASWHYNWDGSVPDESLPRGYNRGRALDRTSLINVDNWNLLDKSGLGVPVFDSNGSTGFYNPESETLTVGQYTYNLNRTHYHLGDYPERWVKVAEAVTYGSKPCIDMPGYIDIGGLKCSVSCGNSSSFYRLKGGTIPEVENPFRSNRNKRVWAVEK